MEIEKIIYIIILLTGFLVPFIISYILNKKFKIIKNEYFIYSYIIFAISLIVCAKIFHIFLNFNFNSVYNYINSKDIVDKLSFILSGYTFIGGFIGGILAILFFMKVIHQKNDSIIILYLLNLILMYAILKVGCFINGCCYGIWNIPVQIIESIVNFILYFLVLILFIKEKNKKSIIAKALIGFGSLRFVISFFRVYTNCFAFIFNQIFCLILIIIGMKNMKNVDNLQIK